MSRWRVTSKHVDRTFTLEEANALVPRVIATFARTTQLVANARRIARRLMAAGVRPERPGQLPDPASVAHDPGLAADLTLATSLAEAALDEAKALEALGIHVRDVERGLVDFRSIIDGQRAVWLCWQLGEQEICCWHELEAGFVGRRPVVGHQFFRTRQLNAPRD